MSANTRRFSRQHPTFKWWAVLDNGVVVEVNDDPEQAMERLPGQEERWYSTAADRETNDEDVRTYRRRINDAALAAKVEMLANTQAYAGKERDMEDWFEMHPSDDAELPSSGFRWLRQEVARTGLRPREVALRIRTAVEALEAQEDRRLVLRGKL